MISTDFGNGVTASDYPKQVKTWKRGTELKDANLIFEGKEQDMGVWGYTFATENKTYQLIMQKTSFYSGSYFVIEKGELIGLDLPEDVDLSTIFNGLVIAQLKSDWTVGNNTFKQGSVISINTMTLFVGIKIFNLLSYRMNVPAFLKYQIQKVCFW